MVANKARSSQQDYSLWLFWFLLLLYNLRVHICDCIGEVPDSSNTFWQGSPSGTYLSLLSVRWGPCLWSAYRCSQETPCAGIRLAWLQTPLGSMPESEAVTLNSLCSQRREMCIFSTWFPQSIFSSFWPVPCSFSLTLTEVQEGMGYQMEVYPPCQEWCISV